MKNTINFEEADFRNAVGKMYVFGALTGGGMVILLIALMLSLDATTGMLQTIFGQSAGQNTGGNGATRASIELIFVIAGLVMIGFGSFKWLRFLKRQREYFNRLAMSNPPPLKHAPDYV